MNQKGKPQSMGNMQATHIEDVETNAPIAMFLPCCTCHARNLTQAQSCALEGVKVKKQICSFDGCADEVCEADKESPNRMHFCQTHHDQLAQYVKDNAVPKILGFWVKANGGAKKLASTF